MFGCAVHEAADVCKAFPKGSHIQLDRAGPVRFPQFRHTFADKHKRQPPSLIALKVIERAADAMKEGGQIQVVCDDGGRLRGDVFFKHLCNPFGGLLEKAGRSELLRGRPDGLFYYFLAERVKCFFVFKTNMWCKCCASIIYLFPMAKNKHGPTPGTQYKNIQRTKLGSNIAAVRRLRGISQETLADKTGISSRMISYYERESENIPASKLLKIAEALKVTTDRLLNEQPDISSFGTSRALLKRIETLKKLPTGKQKVVIDLIDQFSGKKTTNDL